VTSCASCDGERADERPACQRGEAGRLRRRESAKHQRAEDQGENGARAVDGELALRTSSNRLELGVNQSTHVPL